MKKIKPEELTDNPIKLIGKDWMLVTAGTPGEFNTMTASWGGVGFLWNKPVAFVFVRHERYTFAFTEREEVMTLSFFDEKYRKALSLLGTKSGPRYGQSGRIRFDARPGGQRWGDFRAGAGGTGMQKAVRVRSG